MEEEIVYYLYFKQLLKTYKIKQKDVYKKRGSKSIMVKKHCIYYKLNKLCGIKIAAKITNKNRKTIKQGIYNVKSWHIRPIYYQKQIELLNK